MVDFVAFVQYLCQDALIQCNFGNANSQTVAMHHRVFPNMDPRC